jgi:predicted glycosyltransferase
MTRRVFIISQHGFGLGHLSRSSALAAALQSSGDYEVTLFSGGQPIAEYIPPKKVDFVQLPPTRFITLTETNTLACEAMDDDKTVEQVDDLRSEIIMNYFYQLKPSAIITEYYPFAPERFGHTLDALLRASREEKSRCKMICSIRSVPIDATLASPADINHLLNKYYDHVLHHADERLFSIDSLGDYVSQALDSIPCTQTGFICQHLPVKAADVRSDGGLLLSVGGGRDGYTYLRSWIEALKSVSIDIFFPVTVLCGPLMPESEVNNLRTLIDKRFDLHTTLVDTSELMRKACAVVSMSGYNTINEALHIGKPLLAFPRKDYVEQEMHVRSYFEKGLLLSGEYADTIDQIADLMLQLASFKPSFKPDFNGSESSVDVIASILGDAGTRNISGQV